MQIVSLFPFLVDKKPGLLPLKFNSEKSSKVAKMLKSSRKSSQNSQTKENVAKIATLKEKVAKLEENVAKNSATLSKTTFDAFYFNLAYCAKYMHKF